MSEGYVHTQRSPLHYVLWVVVAVGAYGAWRLRDEPAAWIPLAAVSAVLLLASLCFQRLTVRDEGDHLQIRFGPLPFFRKRLPYARVHAARPARSRWIDGWGVHWIPGRGWTWNLWGFDCVELETTDGTLRIGTDDRDRLARFLQERVADGLPDRAEDADRPDPA